MADLLSQGAMNWLKGLYERCGAEPSVKCRTGKNLTEVLVYCDERDIKLGKLLNKQSFLVDRKAIVAIKTECDFTVDYKELERREAASFNSDEKRAGIAPTDFRVLAAFSNQYGNVQLSSVYSQPQINVELDIRHLDLKPFTHLIAIENRDSFNYWYKFQMESLFTNPLVIYRGDGEEARWLKVLRSQWQEAKSDCPTVYFGDFDLPGLRWAMTYQQLLLPSKSWLEHNLKGEHFEAKHQPFAEKLIQDCPEGWRELLDLSLKQQKALRQQWMEDIPLFIYPR